MVLVATSVIPPAVRVYEWNAIPAIHVALVTIKHAATNTGEGDQQKCAVEIDATHRKQLSGVEVINSSVHVTHSKGHVHTRSVHGTQSRKSNAHIRPNKHTNIKHRNER